jgi:hypothetical protein
VSAGQKFQFVSAELWAYITAGVRRRPRDCYVAVAYFGDHASDLLPLRANSTLVVDMSERAVRSGQTKPSELVALIRKGVRVHSVQNLHAKGFVLGDRAVVGSSNASRTSANGLIEAALVTRDRRAITDCRVFVDSLTGEPVTFRHARAMQKLYKPPKFGAPGVARKKGKAMAPAHSRFWIAPLFRDATGREYEEAEKGTGRASGRMKEPKRSRLDWFSWSGPKSARQARVEDLALCITKDGRRKFADRPARIADIRRHTKGAIIYLEKQKHSRRKSLNPLVQRLGQRAAKLKSQKNIVSLKDALLVHDLMRLWS